MQTVYDEIIQQISKLTSEEKNELLRRLLILDKELKEKAKKSKADSKSK